MRLTEKFELEEKIAQLEKEKERLEENYRNKEKELKEYKRMAATFSGRTLTLLEYLLKDEDIFAWYRLTNL